MKEIVKSKEEVDIPEGMYVGKVGGWAAEAIKTRRLSTN